MQSKLSSAARVEVARLSEGVASPSVDTKVEVVGEQQDGIGERVLTVHNCSGSTKASAVWRWR